ncbi:unnamed protein product, partial [Discosporangium mesarthrocarpum]
YCTQVGWAGSGHLLPRIRDPYHTLYLPSETQTCRHRFVDHRQGLISVVHLILALAAPTITCWRLQKIYMRELPISTWYLLKTGGGGHLQRREGSLRGEGNLQDK